MKDESNIHKNGEYPNENNISKVSRGAMQAVAGAIPLVGGILSAIASTWSEKEQEKANRFFQHWIDMLKDEIKEKEKTITEIMIRLDLQDARISQKVETNEYQSLLRKAFREWSGAESEEKRIYVRNILANAAASDISSDNVIRLYLDWINRYSELHFQVIGAVYNSNGITRKKIWDKMGKQSVREDSADADLYKLLFRDLSTGGIIRQHRKTDYKGNYMKKAYNAQKKSNIMKSAFDDEDQYELTTLGQQFVHYAMNDLPIKIEYDIH